MRILLLEDDGFHQTMMGEALRSRWPDCQIQLSGTCADALELARDAAYDAFILDLMLPDGDAMDVLRQLRNDGVASPVIMVTGQGDELAAVRAMKEGVSDYIIKRGEYWDLLPRSLEESLKAARRGLVPSTDITGRFLAVDRTVHPAGASGMAGPSVMEESLHELQQELNDERSARWGLEKELRHRTEFVANVSHDLRTPLTAVKNSLEILQSDFDTGLSREVRHFMEVARRGADRLAQILDDLLDMSRLEAGRFDLRLQPVDLDELCAGVVAEMQPAAAAAHLELSYVRDAAESVVYADPARIREVMRTLLSQAIRASLSWASVRVTLEAGEAQMLRVTVRDSMPPMSVVDLETLFDRYVPGQGPSDGARQGAGLSLPLARELILAHSGDIRAAAVQDGNEIRFTLPVHSEDTMLLLELESEKKKARRQFSSVSLILFRVLNPEPSSASGAFGPHDPAAALLRTMAANIRSGTGKALWCRGALPTVAVLATAGREGALVLANRLRQALCACGASSLGLDRPLYLEFGISVYPEEWLDGKEIIAAAAADREGEFIVS